MDTKKYELYCREFKNFKGEVLGYKDLNGKWHYGNFPLLKFGYQEVGKDRVEQNYLKERENRWKDLWGEINLYRKVVLNLPLQEVKRLETLLSQTMEKKDFWMKEQVNGITEFRMDTPWRRQRVETFFNTVEEKYGN